MKWSIPGIKKRNHKMLDYDAMRSKVKKLVEKPDKDPAKLPRTEKEAEMVSPAATFRNEDEEIVLDLEMPSPPRALDTIERVQQLQQEDDEMVRRHSGLGTPGGLSRSPSLMSRLSGIGRSSKSSGEEMSTASPSRSSSMNFHLIHDK